MSLGWTRPELLWGLAGLTLPVLAHLAHRQRAQERPWPSLWLVAAVARRVRKRARLRNLALLVLRMAAIAAFVTALAGPRLTPPDAPAGEGASGSHSVGSAAIVLDASFGLRLREEGLSRFERAQRAARAIVEASPPERSLALLVASERSDLLVAPTLDHGRLLRAAGAVGPGWRRGDLGAALSAARRTLAGAPPPHTIYVLTDLAAGAWPRAPVRRLARARVEVLDVRAAPAHNGAVLRARLPSRCVIRGVPFPVEAVVLRQPGRPSRVQLRLDGRVAAERFLPAPTAGAGGGGGKERVEFPRVTLSEPGARRLEVCLADADRLESDNVFRVGLRVREAPRVVACTGRRPAPLPVRGGTSEVPAVRALVLACGRATRLESVRPELLADALARTPAGPDAAAGPDACVLVGPPELSRGAWDRLSIFVEEGGALAVFADESGDFAALREHAFAPGAPYGGLVPGRPAGPARPRPVRSWRVRDPAHPLFAPLSAERGEFDEVRFPAYLKIALDPRDRVARPLADFLGPAGAAAEAAVVEKRYGGGRVLLFAFSPRLGPDAWSDLAVRPCFVVLARRLAEYLAPRSPAEDLGGIAGAPLTLPASIEVAAVRPGEGREFFDRSPALLRHTAPAFWGLRDANGTVYEAGVNVEAAASRLAPIEPEALENLLPGARVRVTPARDLAAASPSLRVGGDGRDLAPWALLLAALLLAAEPLAMLGRVGTGGRREGGRG